MNKILKVAANVTSEVAISGVSAAAGGTVAVYAVNHDPMNDSELSAITGLAAGAATTALTSAILHGVKNSIVTRVYRHKISKEAKKRSFED